MSSRHRSTIRFRRTTSISSCSANRKWRGGRTDAGRRDTAKGRWATCSICRGGNTMRRSNNIVAARAVAAAVGLGAVLAGCSDLYYDRRETILFGADNAVASNNAVQTIDPWPPGSANRRAPANGAVVAAAIARYKTGKVYSPHGNGTTAN